MQRRKMRMYISTRYIQSYAGRLSDIHNDKLKEYTNLPNSTIKIRSKSVQVPSISGFNIRQTSEKHSIVWIDAIIPYEINNSLHNVCTHRTVLACTVDDREGDFDGDQTQE